ncbi:MAG: prolyl oligopeptidase family serine peptidase [Crocinitomicaceae bacterium]|nr:prolyl oligopeptidase family serine peptidase [Crocinitomicaceae bacterium]
MILKAVINNLINVIFLSLVLLISGLFNIVFAQEKKVVSHLEYNNWKTLQNPNISDFGNVISYEIKPHRGDGALFITAKEAKDTLSIERGNTALISKDEKFIVFKIHPGFDTLRKLELDEVKKDKWVKDSLGIIQLINGESVKWPNIKKFQLSEQNNLLVALSYEEQKKVKNESDGKSKGLFSWLVNRKNRSESKDDLIKESGNPLYWCYLSETWKGEKQTIANVADFLLAEKQNILLYSTKFKEDKKEFYQLHIKHFEQNKDINIETKFTAIAKWGFDDNANKLFFLASQDTVKKEKQFELYLWQLDDSQPLKVDMPETINGEKYWPSEHRKPFFSKKTNRLIFGIHEPIPQMPKDTLFKTEKANLDIWHYQDARLQPQQLKELDKDQKKSLLTVLHLNGNQMMVLDTADVSFSAHNNGDADFFLGRDVSPYQSSYNWSYPWLADYFVVNVNTGERTKLKDSIAYSYGLSPKGNYFVYFHPSDNNWYFSNVLTQQDECITCFAQENSNIQWTRDVNGMPHEPSGFGIAGYTKDEHALIFYSELDIWEVVLPNNSLSCITNEHGANNNLELRLIKLEKDSVYIELKDALIQAVDKKRGDHSFLRLRKGQQKYDLETQFTSNHAFSQVLKAKEANQLIFRKGNVKDYPELFAADWDFQVVEKISITNPQQADFRWPTVEKISWTTPEGIETDGLIYKPDDFDINKSYPMLVYFYEMYTDRIHQHYIPRPTASIIFPTEYTSAEYIVFIPDVRYESGYPAKSAYDCIVSGTDEVLKLYPNIDPTRLGLQGQSWGGYQTAQLITMTNKYKAAMAGAPVSNMISAYGGIRWGSGLNRQFQYERTQSRIGATIWDAPELYIENSPLFGVPNIQTPLLIMHNDNDGAVPWYQGIELFTAMKRLGKPVWMLNYNGDDHNLMKNANRMDLSIRMRQFFDHYLQEEPAPKWLLEGLPALEKGKQNALELME